MEAQASHEFLGLPPGPPFLLGVVVSTLVLLALRLALVRAVGFEKYRVWTTRLEQGVLALVLLSMVVLATVQIFLRNVLHSGLLWIDPLLRTLVLWVGFLGAAAATSRGRHIAIEILPLLLKPRARARLARATAVIAAVVCLILANAGYSYLIQEKEFGGEAFLGLRTWVTQSVLLFGFGFLTYRFVVLALFGADLEDPHSLGTAGEPQTIEA